VAAPAAPADTRGRRDRTAEEWLDDSRGNNASGFTCPECQGPLWEVEEYGFSEYLCRIGHRFSPGNLLALERRRSDEQLQSALSALYEESKLGERLLERGQRRGVSPQQLERLAWRVQGLKQRSNDLSRLIEGDELLANHSDEP
jgi:two-component system chemotaxis response regulator CheB